MRHLEWLQLCNAPLGVKKKPQWYSGLSGILWKELSNLLEPLARYKHMYFFVCFYIEYGKGWKVGIDTDLRC